MPELPEVETIVRTLAPQLLGRRIELVRVLHEKSLAAGKDLLPRLDGFRIVSVHRRAKLVCLTLRSVRGEELFLFFHLKMTGRLFVYGMQVKADRHTRLLFCLREDAGQGEDGKQTQLFFDDARKFGYCRIMSKQDVAHWDFWNALGLEPLVCLREEFLARCAKRRGRIKALLLDQTFVAGIGNIYADEILFRACIAPQQTLSHLTDVQLNKLWERMREVLQEAIEHCGSSIRDYRDAHGNAGAFQKRFRVYARGGLPCLRCGDILVKSVVAGRGTVHCPTCQVYTC